MKHDKMLDVPMSLPLARAFALVCENASLAYAYVHGIDPHDDRTWDDVMRDIDTLHRVSMSLPYVRPYVALFDVYASSIPVLRQSLRASSRALSSPSGTFDVTSL